MSTEDLRAGQRVETALAAPPGHHADAGRLRGSRRDRRVDRPDRRVGLHRPVTDQQQWTRHLFTRLVALGEGTEDTKRRLDRAELDVDRIAAHICQLAWPGITGEEWGRYLPGLDYRPRCPR